VKYAVALIVALQSASPALTSLVLPAGFHAEVFAENVGNARMMALGPQGTVFAGTQYAGKVYAVVDRDGDHKADEVLTIASGLRQPNGVAVRHGALYVATTSQILRFDDIEKHLDAPPAAVIVTDNLPNPNQDELNVAFKAGLHFGFPYCHQGDVADPEFGAQRACATTEAPVQKLGAHVAAIGFTFYTGGMFPARYRNAAIIAQHGSWNRSTPSGYRVMAAFTDGRRVTGYEPLVEGFLPAAGSGTPGGRGATTAATGRPADVLQLPDGSILVSDDRANRLIRVSYGK